MHSDFSFQRLVALKNFNKKLVFLDTLLLHNSSDHMQSIDYREEVNDYLHEIYFLPAHPELKDIHTVLQNYKKVSVDTRIIMMMK